MRCITRVATGAIAAIALLAGVAATSASALSPTAASAATTTSSYGITLSGLQDGMSTTQLEAEISAIAQDWNSNTVRLQVEQDKLTWKSGNCPIETDPVCGPYLTQIEAVVNYALGLGLKVVINDQTEPGSGYEADEVAPTHATEVFWKDIAPVWAGNSAVIYDLFNEPRGASLADPSSKTDWNLWRNGGKFADGNTYLGMQDVLSYVRGLSGVTNPVWVEGLNAASSLAGILSGTGTPNIVQDELADPLHNLTYAFHHPYPDSSGDQNTGAWWTDFGYLANHTGGFRVVDGEFNNSVDGGQYCWTAGGVAAQQLPVLWPGYSQYLTSRSGGTQAIGMTGWTIGPVGTVSGVPNMPILANSSGHAITSDVQFGADGENWSLSAPTTDDLNTPAAYAVPATESGNPSQAWTCGASNDASAGQDFQTWYAANGG